MPCSVVPAGFSSCFAFQESNSDFSRLSPDHSNSYFPMTTRSPSPARVLTMSGVEKALNEAGWKVVKREMTATQFYFSRLLEAVPM